MILTASNLWRAAECPASAVLPHAAKKYADAERGRKVHAELEASPPPGSAAEVAYAFDVLSGRAREVGRSIGRDYGKLAEGEIPGTADVVTVQPDHVLVQDYKSGHGYMVAPPADNLQLQHNCLSAATVEGKSLAIAEVIYLKTGEVKAADFDAFDFIAIQERLAGIYSRCKAAEAALVLGGPEALVSSDLISEMKPGRLDPCWRCPAIKSCPLKSKNRRLV